MALIRIARAANLRLASRVSVRCFASDSGKKGEEMFPEAIEHATGDEKKILLLQEKGITDPFYINGLKRGPGTKSNPNLVPSFEEKRLVGCVCEEDATTINWMWVHKGDPKRCECGYWFKAIDAVNHFEQVEKEMEAEILERKAEWEKQQKLQQK